MMIFVFFLTLCGAPSVYGIICPFTERCSVFKAMPLYVSCVIYGSLDLGPRKLRLTVSLIGCACYLWIQFSVIINGNQNDLHDRYQYPLDMEAPRQNRNAYFQECSGFIEDQCVICHETLGSTAVALHCVHKFHRNCITEWLSREGIQAPCPLCRIQIQEIG